MTVLRDKLAFITGGSSGIGLAVAQRMNARGATVVLFARRREALATALDSLDQPDRGAMFEMDVADRPQVEAVLAEAVAEHGAPDILVNSAGVSYPGYFEQLEYDEFDRTVRINLYGTWNTCHVLVPAMKAKGGHIVNVASVAGLLGVFGYSAYAASKFGVVGLSESLRAEMRRFGIRVSVLCPPDTDTPMLAAENRRKPPETEAIAGAAKVLTTDRVVDDLLRGMRKNQFLIVPGFDGKFTALAKRFSPTLVAWVTDRLADSRQA
ncbi:MAG: SDR family oxidoreductase [Candidatus Lernaella stagnicola]|nr:SDR family oxidoreductase [Candidatus Lernaella stagnicola]